MGHLRANGFRVEAVDTDDLAPVKRRHRVPDALSACHTALVEGYVVEGHVPAATIQRLLRERPTIAGIAVPGMPAGSPGMEVAGQPAQHYDVIAFDRDGKTRIFETR